MLDRIRRDLQHYRDRGPFTHLGFWAGAAYRAAAFCRETGPRPLRLLLCTAAGAVNAPLRFFRGVDIPASARIGPGLCLHHPNNVVVSPDAVLGTDCTLYQDVIIGEGGPVPGAPRLGDRVRVFAGAKILGGITVGDDVEIGANAVVTRDVPSGAVVASPAGRPVSRETIERMKR